MARSRRQKKQKRERASARRRAEERQVGFDRTTYRIPEGMSVFVPKPGKYLLDILEYEVGKGNPWADEGQMHYERTFFVHHRVGPDESSYVCPAKTSGKPCPVCEGRQKEARKPNGDDELVKSLKPKERQLFLVYNHAEKDKGLQLMDVSTFNFGARLDKEINDSEDEEGFVDFASWESDEGMTLRCTFYEESFAGNNFSKCDTIRFLKRKEDIPQEVLEQVVCLDDLLIIPDYDKLKATFLQVEADDDEDEDEEEEDRPKPKRGRTRKAEEPEDDDDLDLDDDDEEPWDSEDEEEEPEEKPKPKRGRAKKEPEPEPDDEDDHDEDWDDDEDWDSDGDEDEEENEPEPEPKPKRGRGKTTTRRSRK